MQLQLSVPSHKHRQILPRSEFNPEIPPKATIKLQPAKDAYTSSVRDSYIASDQITMYAGSVLSIPVSYHEDEMDNQDTLVPLRNAPDYTIQGKYNTLFFFFEHSIKQNLFRKTWYCITLDASKQMSYID